MPSISGRALSIGSGHFVFEAERGMTVTINGQPMELPDGLTVDELLARLAVKREFTAVAVNRDVTPRASYASTTLREGDRVEIVRPMGGG